MGYKVDLDALDTLYYSINNKAVEWSDSLGEVYDSVNALAASECITGAGAENIKSYLSEVHSMVIGLLGQIIASHTDNCLLYKRDYQDNIDSSVHAVIHEDELTDIASKLQSYRSQTSAVDSNIKSALTSISDIFYNQSYRGYSTVDNDYETTKRKIDTLDQDIHSLENSHLNSDFTNTEVLLDKLIAYLNTQLGKPKSYKTEFNLETAQKDTTLQEIARSYLALSEEADSKREALAIAGENEQARIEILQKEYEDRQNTATVINWVVTGLCIVGSVALTVATCGGAAPLTVALTAGAISAGGGVIMAGTQSITSQWVETGDLSKTNWLDVGKCSLLGGATGFVTGFIGAGAGGFITSKLAGAAITAPLVNSSSTVTRVATHFAIGSVSEVTSGTISRFAGGMISTGDVSESFRQAIDPKSMIFDAVLGGATNSVQGFKTPINSAYSKLETDVDSIKLPEGIWEKGVVDRGKDIDILLENNVGSNYPVIDRIDEQGIVTSVKSRDLSCKTYQDGKTLEYVIKKDIDKITSFSGRNWNGIKIKPSDISGKQLQLVVPNIDLSASQIEAINNSIKYAATKDIKIIITVGI